MYSDPFSFPGGPALNPTPEILVADFEAVAIPDPGLVPRAVVAVLASAGFPVEFEEARLLAGVPVRVQLAELIAVSAGLPLTAAFELSVRVESEFGELLWSQMERGQGFKPVTGADDVFAAVQSEGIRVVLDSMLPAALTRRILDRFGWIRSGLVDSVAFSEEVEAPRPSPDLLLEAVRKLFPQGSDRIAKLVGGRLDIVAAKAARCRWLLDLDRGGLGGGSPAIRRQGVRQVESLGDLPEVLLGWVLR